MECGRYNTNCVPFILTVKGDPLGVLCAGKSCGAWVCKKEEHSVKIVAGHKILRYCLDCKSNENIPEKYKFIVATKDKKDGLKSSTSKVKRMKRKPNSN